MSGLPETIPTRTPTARLGRRIGRLLALPPEDRRLLLEAAALLAACTVAQRVASPASLRSAARRLARHWTPRAGRSADRLGNAVTLASRGVPGAYCLPVALTACALLEREGHPAELRIGVARTARGGWSAHAWVESGGQVVVGGPPALVRRYTPLPLE